MTDRTLWFIIYMAIVLVVLSVLWAVQTLANSAPRHDEYEKNKEWARKQLGGRSTM